MALVKSQTNNQEFTVSNVTDLNITNVTNLFNTGDPNVNNSSQHQGAVTVRIPQSTVFTDGGGRYVNLGDFGIVQKLASGELTLDAGLYTVGQLQSEPEYNANAKENWNVAANQALLG